MVKVDLVEKVYEKVGFSKKEAAKAVDTFFEILKEALERGETVKLHGFGCFMVRTKGSRKGRNPKTGEVMEISPHKVLVFRPSSTLRHFLNRQRGG